MKTEVSRKTTKSSKKKTKGRGSPLFFFEIKDLKDEPMLASEYYTGGDTFSGELILSIPSSMGFPNLKTNLWKRLSFL